VPGAVGTPFACGQFTCQPGYFCLEGIVDYPTEIWYSCNVAPSGCLPTPTCACLRQEIPASTGCSPIGYSCSDDGAGHATISVDEP
jgi:hypothetical protein